MNRLNSISRNRRSLSSASGILNRLSGDGAAALKGAYSVRRLSMTYTGPTMNVRRGSDNATSDFYGNVTGTALGTSLDAEGTSLSSWLGGATGFVTQWHDQSGAGAHATQSTTGSQPIINATALLIDTRTARFFSLPNGTVTSGNNKFTCVIRHGVVRSSSGPAFIGAGAQATSQAIILYRQSLNYAALVWGGAISASAGYADNSVISYVYNQSTLVMFKNGTQIGSSSVSGLNVAMTNNRIASYPSSGYTLDGDLYNVFIFNTDISPTDRNLCESV